MTVYLVIHTEPRPGRLDGAVFLHAVFCCREDADAYIQQWQGDADELLTVQEMPITDRALPAES